MPADTIDLSLDAVGERAEAYYDSVLRAQVETRENTGKFLLLDTLTNRYVIGTDRLALSRELAAEVPEAVCKFRIGYPATTSIGGDLRPLSEMTIEEVAQLRQRIRRSDLKP